LEVIDHFREMDTDRSGEISLKEFRQAIRALGFVHASKESVDATFAVLDDNHSGSITYSELDKKLRRLGERELLFAPPIEGAALLSAGEKVAHGHADRRPRPVSSSRLTPGAQALQRELYNELVSKHSRVIDLFRRWDGDHSGQVDKKEFREVLLKMGYSADVNASDELFDSFDRDSGRDTSGGNGLIEYQEMYQLLRRRAELEPELQAGDADPG